MFPVTITIHNAEQFNAVMSAFPGGTQVASLQKSSATKTEAAAEKKSAEKSPPPAQETKVVAATEAAATQATVAEPAVREKKAEVSAAGNVMDADTLANTVRAAIAKSGRDTVVALIKSYNVSKASEVEAAKRPEFDAKLTALAE